jgi:hypothetical protein
VNNDSRDRVVWINFEARERSEGKIAADKPTKVIRDLMQ